MVELIRLVGKLDWRIRHTGASLQLIASTPNPYTEFGAALSAFSSLLQWLIAHPLGGAVLGFLGLFLLWGLLRSLTYLMERLWLALLQSPWWAGRRIWTSLQARRGSPTDRRSSPASATPPSQSDQDIEAIVARLETLQQEQQTLLQEVKAYLQNR
jgi:hypothetical protein